LNTQQLNYATVAAKLSAILGRKWGVTIIFGGHPATDGSQIVLPHWNLDDPLLRTALYGLIAHEAGGHIRQTDFGILAKEIGIRKSKPLFTEWKSLANILEDIRIEANLLRLYPGAATYLNAAVNVMLCGDRKSQPPEKIDNYWDLALGWCLLHFRCHQLDQQALKDAADSYSQVLGKHVPAEAIVDAIKIATQVAAIGPDKADYASVLVHTDQLLALLHEHSPRKQPSGSEVAQGADSPAASNSASSSSAPMPASGESHDDGNSAADGTPSTADDGDGTKTGEATATKDDEAQAGSPCSDAGDPATPPGETMGPQGAGPSSAQDGAGSQSSAAQILSGEGATSEVGDIFGDLRSVGANPNPNITRMDSLGHSDKPPVLALNKKVVTALAGKGQALRQSIVAALSPMICGDAEYSRRSLTGTRLDTRHLSRVVTDADPAVYRRLHVDEDQSVAVQILIDRSGSTSGRVLDAEIISAIGLATALDQFDSVESAISYFPSDQGYLAWSAAPFIKGFGTPIRSTLHKWPAASGGTPLGKAYEACVFNFLHTQLERKILIVLTDGVPDNPHHASDQLAVLTALGVEVYGVVITDRPYPTGIFHDSEQIAVVTDLPAKLSQLVRRNI